jgi:hypothetical protein
MWREIPGGHPEEKDGKRHAARAIEHIGVPCGAAKGDPEAPAPKKYASG